MRKRLLICVAINEELKIFRKLMENQETLKQSDVPFISGELEGVPVDVLLTSMGMQTAGTRAHQFIDEKKHAGVLVVGYCGGLSLTLKNADVVIASRVVSSQDGKIFEIDHGLIEELGKGVIQEGLRYRAVPLTTQPLVIETPQEKKKLFDLTRAEAVDMEASEVVRAADQKGVRFAVIKVVIDDAETETPHFNEIFKRTGRMDQLSITKAMVSQPALSMQLSKNMKRARAVIETALPRCLAALRLYWNF